ncbi:MAG: DUF4040 domain-containing protein [Alphaproteobacteria bacterium]
MMFSSIMMSTAPSTLILDVSLMAMLVVVAVAIVRLRSLFAIVMLQGVYSLLSAAWFVSLDAVDVAFTEAAVGAGISTVLMLAAMLLADRDSHPVPMSKQVGPLTIVILAGIAMFYAIGDMPAYGDINSAANSYVGMDYMAKTAEDIHIPNVVTAVLGSYRGYDTFGEVVVIFSAGLGVLLLLGLNGNAGKWRAEPKGIRISPAAAPAARRKPAPRTPKEEVPAEQPSEVKAKVPTKKKATPKTAAKKTATKKPVAKKAAAKKVAAKKPAAKKPAAKKTVTTKKNSDTKKGDAS